MRRPATKLNRTLEVGDRTFRQNALSEPLFNHGDKAREPLFSRLGFHALDCSCDSLADDWKMTEFLRLPGRRSGDCFDVLIGEGVLCLGDGNVFKPAAGI